MPIDRLSATDQLMLRASRIWPQDNGGLAILDGSSLLDIDGRLRIDAVRAAIEARLHLAPRFRQLIYVPAPGLGGPLWVDAPHFDVREPSASFGLLLQAASTSFSSKPSRCAGSR